MIVNCILGRLLIFIVTIDIAGHNLSVHPPRQQERLLVEDLEDNLEQRLVVQQAVQIGLPDVEVLFYPGVQLRLELENVQDVDFLDQLQVLADNCIMEMLFLLQNRSFDFRLCSSDHWTSLVTTLFALVLLDVHLDHCLGHVAVL